MEPDEMMSKDASGSRASGDPGRKIRCFFLKNTVFTLFTFSELFVKLCAYLRRPAGGSDEMSPMSWYHDL
jgi:hypothetical protein